MTETNQPQILELQIQITGEAKSNIVQYQESVLAQIESLGSKRLETDEDFAAAEQVAKLCKEQEVKLKEATEQAKQESASISDVFAAIDRASEIFRNTRLNLERQIKAEKENRRGFLLNEAITAVRAKNSELIDRFPGLTKINSSFGDVSSYMAEAIKGKKSFSTMQAALDQSVELFCADLETCASKLYANMSIIKSRHDQFLFGDAATLATLPTDKLLAEIERRELAHAASLENARRQEEARLLKAQELKAAQAAKEAEKQAEPAKAEEQPAQEPAKVAEPAKEEPARPAYSVGANDPVQESFKIKVTGTWAFVGTMEEAKIEAGKLRDLFGPESVILTKS